MNDIEYVTEHDQRAHLLLERHLVVGAHTYLITASGTGEETIHLCLTGRDPAGATVGEITGSIPPTDLPSVAEAVNSVLAGLVAMRPRSGRAGKASAAERPKDHPKQGTRWSSDDDQRLLTRYGEGAREKTLVAEFGRTRGGIRARLEGLGAIPPGSRLPYRDRVTPGSAPTDDVPADGQGTQVTESTGPVAGGKATPAAHGAVPDGGTMPITRGAVADGGTTVVTRGAGDAGPAAVVLATGERRMPRLLARPPETDWPADAPWPEAAAPEDPWRAAAPEDPWRAAAPEDPWQEIPPPASRSVEPLTAEKTTSRMTTTAEPITTGWLPTEAAGPMTTGWLPAAATAEVATAGGMRTGDAAAEERAADSATPQAVAEAVTSAAAWAGEEAAAEVVASATDAVAATAGKPAALEKTSTAATAERARAEKAATAVEAPTAGKAATAEWTVAEWVAAG